MGSMNNINLINVSRLKLIFLEENDLEYEEEIRKFGEEIEPQFRNRTDFMAWFRKQLPCIEVK